MGGVWLVGFGFLLLLLLLFFFGGGLFFLTQFAKHSFIPLIMQV